jgi:hypothetical protein
MEKLNIHVTREYFKLLLRKICSKYGKKRSEVGIISGARAELYFDSKWESVSFDAIEELALKGTDIVFIEKEGIIDELKPHADKYGVAMVNSRGYLTEYAHDLIEAARESGANIIIITDYDLSGANLASKCSQDIPWVTMDDSTLEYFDLQKDGTIVVGATNKKLIERVEEIIEEDTRFADLDIDFLRTSRIEINAVIAQVGDVRFWKFIMDKLQQLYPTRNYNRAIKLPSQDLGSDETDLYPSALRKFILHIRDIVKTAIEETEKDIELEQESVRGFLEVETQKQKNKDLVIKAIAEDVEIRAIESNLIKLCESLGIDLTTEITGDYTSAHFRSRKKSR